MHENNVTIDYFDWMYNLVCRNRYSKNISFKKVFSYLNDTKFTYSIRMDLNRAKDGTELRRRYANEFKIANIYDRICGPCSVLEMMIALANRCEVDYMDDPAFGDRTVQWFWGMIANLGLGSMIDTRYDKQHVDEVLYTFLNRKYERDGRGGLFRIRDSHEDMRKVEIWYQMCYYLDTFV